MAGMPWFDAICHTFATLATGGFSTQNASMGAYYANPWIDWITIGFMVLAGVNFGLYYQLVNRRFMSVFRDPGAAPVSGDHCGGQCDHRRQHRGPARGADHRRDGDAGRE